MFKYPDEMSESFVIREGRRRRDIQRATDASPGPLGQRAKKTSNGDIVILIDGFNSL